MLYDRFFFCMNANKQGRFRKNSFQALRVINQHVAGRSTHKDLQPANCGGISFFDLSNVIIGCTKKKGIIGQRFGGCQFKFFFQNFERGGVWSGVGHLHVRGYPSCYSSAAFGMDIAFTC